MSSIRKTRPHLGYISNFFACPYLKRLLVRLFIHSIYIVIYIYTYFFFQILNFTNYSGIVVNIVNIVILPGNFTGF